MGPVRRSRYPATALAPAGARAAAPGAARLFAVLNKTQRYAVLHPVVTAPNDTVRAARIARQVARLEERDREETP